jgi:hypothetical protein
VFVQHDLGEMIGFEVALVPNVLFNPRLEISEKEYQLVGIVYLGHSHFVSRVISSDLKVFLHDGIYGAYSMSEGELGEDISVEELSQCGDKTPTLALYVLD